MATNLASWETKSICLYCSHHSFSASVVVDISVIDITFRDVRSCILMGMLHVSLAAAVKHSFSASVAGR